MEITNQLCIRIPVDIIHLSLRRVIVLLKDTITDEKQRKYDVGGVLFEQENNQ